MAWFCEGRETPSGPCWQRHSGSTLDRLEETGSEGVGGTAVLQMSMWRLSRLSQMAGSISTAVVGDHAIGGEAR
jgi:hypothetical protein